MATHSDFVTATLSGTANTETKVGTISVEGGATIKQIIVAGRLSVGTVINVRLDYTGIKTPKKWVFPTYVDVTGTEVNSISHWDIDPINVNIKLPSNISTVDVYATGDQNSVKVAVGLVWV